MMMPRKKTYGRTIKGELITEEFIETAVKRAEAGYDVEELLRQDAEAKAAQAPGARARIALPRPPRRRR
jgi:hypothetical protein